MFEELWNYGFPQEMTHFVDCVKNDKQPLVTGEDARAVLEVIFAAYESAGTGRKVTLPFKTNAAKPFDLWMSSLLCHVQNAGGYESLQVDTNRFKLWPDDSCGEQ